MFSEPNSSTSIYIRAWFFLKFFYSKINTSFLGDTGTETSLNGQAIVTNSTSLRGAPYHEEERSQMVVSLPSFLHGAPTQSTIWINTCNKSPIIGAWSATWWGIIPGWYFLIKHFSHTKIYINIVSKLKNKTSTRIPLCHFPHQPSLLLLLLHWKKSLFWICCSSFPCKFYIFPIYACIHKQYS